MKTQDKQQAEQVQKPTNGIADITKNAISDFWEVLEAFLSSIVQLMKAFWGFLVALFWLLFPFGPAGKFVAIASAWGIFLGGGYIISKFFLAMVI